MGNSQLSVRLRCSTWAQLVSIYRRDLVRGELFLKTSAPPPSGTPMRIHLLLPSGHGFELGGTVAKILTETDHGRGQGCVVALDPMTTSVKVALEGAVQSAVAHTSKPPVPPPTAAAPAPTAATRAPSPPAASNNARPATGDENVSLADTLSLEDGQDLIAAESELHRALKTEAATFARLNPFQVLGVGYGATDTSVRAAFAELSKRYHPDRFVRYQSEEVSQLAAELFIASRDAYTATATAELRDALHEQIKRERRPRKPPPPELLRLTKRSRAAAPTAQHRPGDATPARAPTPEPTPAVDEPDPLVAFPSARAMLAERKFTDAAGLFSIEARRDRTNNAARAGLELAEALRALEQGDRLEAAQRFEAVLDLHPANEVAARELAKMRRRTSNERQGLLAKLMTDTSKPWR